VGSIGGVSKGQADNPQTGGSASPNRKSCNGMTAIIKVTAYTLGRVAASLARGLLSPLTERDDESNAATIRLANQFGRSFTEILAGTVYTSVRKQDATYWRARHS
jgi:hypothetical protein